MTFDKIKAELAKGRGGLKRTLAAGGKTRLYLIEGTKDAPTKIGFRYHDTDVVVFYPEFVELQSGGWLTQTTKERMNWGLNLAEINAGGVSQDKKVWYVGSSEYFDGIRIDYSGIVLNPREKTPEVKLKLVNKEYLHPDNPDLAEHLKQHDPNAQRIAQKLIDRYIAKLSKAIDSGDLDLTGAGACWLCSMITADNKTLGEATGDNVDHLVSHLKDRYLMIHLIINALKSKGYAYPGIFVIGARDKPDIDTIRSHKWAILPAVRTYFERKLITQLITEKEISVQNNES